MCCTSVRDLLKDAPLTDRDVTEKEREDKTTQHWVGFEPTPLCHEACATTAAQLPKQLVQQFSEPVSTKPKAFHTLISFKCVFIKQLVTISTYDYWKH